MVLENPEMADGAATHSEIDRVPAGAFDNVLLINYAWLSLNPGLPIKILSVCLSVDLYFCKKIVVIKPISTK